MARIAILTLIVYAFAFAANVAAATPLVLRSGKSFENVNTMVFHPSNGKPVTFQLQAAVQDGTSMADLLALSDEIFEEAWGPSAESYGFVRARVDLKSRPIGILPFNTAVTTFYERNADGIWARNGRNSPTPPKKLEEVVLKSGERLAVVVRRFGFTPQLKGRSLLIDTECLSCPKAINPAQLAGITYDALVELTQKQRVPNDITGAELRCFAKQRTSAWEFPSPVSINMQRSTDGIWQISISREKFIAAITEQTQRRAEAGKKFRKETHQ
jgi:hypothetical protein